MSAAKSIAQLAQYADVVVTMVPATQHVINVLKGTTHNLLVTPFLPPHSLIL